MSETVARHRPSTDLDEYERRRDSHSQRNAHDDDPLAELARLVGEQHDPYGDVFAQGPASVHPPEDLRPSYEPHGRQEPAFGRAPPRFAADFAAIEAGLRGAPSAPSQQAPHGYAASAQQDYAQHEYAQQGYAQEPQLGASHENLSWSEPQRASAPRGSRRPVYAMAATIAVAVIGIGVAFAYKGTSSSPREIKTIMAAAGPTKIQPPADASADQTVQDAGALAQQPAPTKLVSHEEQPVDLAQTIQDKAAHDAANGGTDAASVPVPLSPGQAAATMNPDYSAQGGAAPDAGNAAGVSPIYGSQGFGVGMPTPKKVKVVSVRPDGTIMPGDGSTDATPPAESAPPAEASDRASPTIPAAAPTAASRKSTSRIATAPAPVEDTAGDDAPVAPPKPAKTARKAKPVHVASAETGTPEATEASETKPAGAGAFAVQLAAPGSEADARSATSRLLKKYGSALTGRRLGFHRAESNGRTVYRVRVSSLTKEEAVTLCTKLKADGGTCFVAKN